MGKIQIQKSVKADELHYLIAIGLIGKVGAVTGKNLVHYCGDARSVFKAPKRLLAKVPGVGDAVIKAIRSAEVLDRAEKELEYCLKNEINIIPFSSPIYPKRLKAIHDSPLLLFAKGKLEQLNKNCVAVVGTRKPSNEGRRSAKEFAGWLARQGVNVVSGLAYGIDIEAHDASVDEAGGTTAVLGHGLDCIYPFQHTCKAEEIAEKGLLISEYVTGVKPEAGNFPARNRIIAGLSRSVLVVEATRTGGALITAKMAFDQDREVYAIPGALSSKTSEGCNALIRDQIARLVTHPKEIVEDFFYQGVLGLSGDDTKATYVCESEGNDYGRLDSLDKIEKVIYEAVGDEGARLDEIAEQVDLPLGDLNRKLMAMSLSGMLTQRPGGVFFRA